MARSTANLHVVASEPSPEDALALLFAQEDELTRQLGEVRRAAAKERERYRQKHNLLMLPSIDTLRRLHG